MSDPFLLGSLDLSRLRARVVDEEGLVTITIDDGEVSVSFEAYVGGSPEQAILGAQRLASVVQEYVETLTSQTKPASARQT